MNKKKEDYQGVLPDGAKPVPLCEICPKNFEQCKKQEQRCHIYGTLKKWGY